MMPYQILTQKSLTTLTHSFWQPMACVWSWLIWRPLVDFASGHSGPTLYAVSFKYPAGAFQSIGKMTGLIVSLGADTETPWLNPFMSNIPHLASSLENELSWVTQNSNKTVLSVNVYWLSLHIPRPSFLLW